MTSDQITGVVRTLAVYLVTLAASHGWLPTGAESDVVAAIVAAAVAAWSIYSNRAKTITPISQK